MSYTKGPARIALVTFDGRSVSTDAYDSIEELVSSRFESSMGLAPYYGHPEHVAALQRLHERLGAAIEAATDSAARDSDESGRDWGSDDGADECIHCGGEAGFYGAGEGCPALSNGNRCEFEERP